VTAYTCVQCCHHLYSDQILNYKKHRYIFPLIFHLARGGKWGESVEEFEERKRKEEGGEEADKMETGKLGEEEQKTKQGEIEQNN